LQIIRLYVNIGSKLLKFRMIKILQGPKIAYLWIYEN